MCSSVSCHHSKSMEPWSYLYVGNNRQCLVFFHALCEVTPNVWRSSCELVSRSRGCESGACSSCFGGGSDCEGRGEHLMYLYCVLQYE